MTIREELAVRRERINKIDGELMSLFVKRMDAAGEIGEIKARGNLALTDEAREREVVAAAVASVPAEYAGEAAAFANSLIALSKLRQRNMTNASDPAAFPEAVPFKTEGVRAAFQGVPGAWGESAAEKLFPEAALCGLEYFEDVFEAVKRGEYDYGVVPIENSQTGAIGEVYDLLRGYGCYIIAQTWLPVSQCLLALPGAGLSDIREILSHPQGFGQCRHFLKGHNWELTACRNTAEAARLVAERGERRFAAIGSRNAARVHGLDVIAPDIADNAGNKTRFIAIASEPVYGADSDTVSVTFSTAHRSGALCAVLEAFMLAEINLSRIESRPVSAERYRFFTDLQANINDPATVSALRAAAAHCSYFEILGAYKN